MGERSLQTRTGRFVDQQRVFRPGYASSCDTSELCFGDSLARLSQGQPRLLRDERPVLETSTPYARNAPQIGHVFVKHAHSSFFWVQHN